MQTINFPSCNVELAINLAMNWGVPQDFEKGELHQANFFEVMILNKAEGTLVIDQQRIDLEDGLIIFLSPLQRRQWFVEGKHVDAHFLVFQEQFLNDFFADQLFTYRLQYFYQRQHPYYFKPDDLLFERLQVIISEIRGELTNFRCDSAHLLRSLLYFLLIRLNRDYALTYDLGTESQINNHAYEFKKLLEAHIQTKQRIEDYTDMLGISRITLNKATQAQFRQSASQLIKDKLYFEIKNALVYTQATINEIAHELNFSEPTHFVRFFKRMSGLTPAVYREAYQNGHL